MGASHMDPYYEEMLLRAKARLDAANEAVKDAMDFRSSVARLAVDVGKMPKTRVGELLEIGRNQVGEITRDTRKKETPRE